VTSQAPFIQSAWIVVVVVRPLSFIRRRWNKLDRKPGPRSTPSHHLSLEIIFRHPSADDDEDDGRDGARCRDAHESPPPPSSAVILRSLGFEQ
jgi:hypothetical protein